MIPPPDRRCKIQALKRMLDNDPSPVVCEPPVLQGFDERNAEVHGEDHDGVGDGEDKGVARDQAAESP
jgi:hypothetical protein